MSSSFSNDVYRFKTTYAPAFFILPMSYLLNGWFPMNRPILFLTPLPIFYITNSGQKMPSYTAS